MFEEGEKKVKICVISPIQGQAGNSIASIFIAMSLALIQQKKTCLTHVDFSKQNLKALFSLPDIKDVTTSLTQVVKLVQTRSILSDDILNYTSPILSGFYFYSTYQAFMEETLFIRDYEILIKSMQAFNHIIIDFDFYRSEKIFDKCVQLSDLIVITINQDSNVLAEGLKLYDNLIKNMEEDNKKKFCFLLNKYDSVIGSYKEFASKLKIKPKELMSLNYSPYIIKCSNKGIIEDCFKSALNNDVRTSNIKQDMLRIAKYIQNLELNPK